VGRATGRPHRTPVNLFRSGDGFVIALTYGRRRDWVANVLAAGSCELETRGSLVAVVDPRIIADRRARLVPFPIRPILRLIGVDEYLVLRRTA
jgi:deazaflavin-dependent oxidoreductase (nitroreductase family)